ncbi:hypothetical protein BC940DRAFT_361260 [Gongronella butleri]|nr:hypothetical protein BC940DRAFT_361260 [Gongronella butleri]
MDLHRDSGGVIMVPVELMTMILRLVDRATLLQIRGCSVKLRVLATPMVFDKLYAEFFRPTQRADHDFKTFKRFWLCHGRATRMLNASRRVLRPMIRSITIGTDRINRSHMVDLLANCHQVTHVGLIIYGSGSSNVSARITEVMALVVTTERIEGVTFIGHLNRIHAYMTRIQGRHTIRHLTITHPTTQPFVSSMGDPIHTMTRLTPEIVPLLSSITMDVGQFDHFRGFRTRVPHRPDNDQHACLHCANPLLTIERVSFGVARTPQDPRMKFAPLIAYVCVKFPRTRTLEFHIGTYHEHPLPDHDHSELNLLERPLNYLPSLTLIEINHPAVLEILPVLREFHLAGPNAPRRITVKHDAPH